MRALGPPTKRSIPHQQRETSMSLETSFYDIINVETSEDCDHGHCVGLTINHGGGDQLVWLYVKDKETADTLAEQLRPVVKEVQLVDYV